MNSSDFQATMHEPSAKQYNVKENMFISKLSVKYIKSCVLLPSPFLSTVKANYEVNEQGGEVSADTSSRRNITFCF